MVSRRLQVFCKGLFVFLLAPTSDLHSMLYKFIHQQASKVPQRSWWWGFRIEGSVQIFRILITGTGMFFCCDLSCTHAVCWSTPENHQSQASLQTSGRLHKSFTKHSPSTIVVVRNLHCKLSRNIQQISHHRDMFHTTGQLQVPCKQARQARRAEWPSIAKKIRFC